MKISIASIILAFYIFLLNTTASAAAFVVMNTNDSGTGSLREAVTNANLTTQPDEIVFDWTVFGSAQTITLTGGEILITQPLKIIGPGANLLKISGNSNSRVFFLRNTAVVNMNNLTLMNGKAPFSNPNGGFGNYAGGIYIDGGQLYLSQVTITGCRAEQAGGIYNGRGVLHVINSSITNNRASGGRNDGSYGGGINNDGELVVAGSTISGNSAQGGDPPVGSSSVGRGNGGGIHVFGGIVTITNSTISSNTAFGGNSPTYAGAASAGGLLLGASSERLTSVVIANTVINNNQAIAGTGGGQASGGGITNLKDLELFNVTLSGNQIISSTGSQFSGGAGIWNGCSGCMTLTNTTVVNNNAANDLPGGGVYAYSSFRLRNTIIAGNSSRFGPDVFDIATSFGNNFIGNNDRAIGLENGVNNDRVGTPAAPLNPMLAPLAANGGATQSHLPLESSPVINNGNNCVLQSAANGGCLTNPLITDQRGFTRLSPSGGTVDIGAVEYGAAVSSTITPAVPDLQSSSDLGISNTDNLTSSRAPVFDIAGVPAQATVDLLRNGIVVASAYTANGGTVSLTDAPNANGIFNYTSRVTVAAATGSASAPLSVVIDTVRPTVTINQSAGQSDPTDVLPITFLAEFSKPVYGVNASKISFAGSTAGTSLADLTITPVGQGGTQYLIAVGNITSTGQVRVSLTDGAAFDSAGNTSFASTSTDNTVNFNLIIEVTLEGKLTRSSGVIKAVSLVTLTDNQTGAVYSTITNQFGYFHFKNVLTYQQTGRTFTINIRNKGFSSISQQLFINSDLNDLNIMVP